MGVPYFEFVNVAEKAFLLTIRATGEQRPITVDVRCVGQTAAIQWDDLGDTLDIQLFLPGFKPEKILSRQEADRLTGLWLHELGHVLYTGAQGAADAMARGGGTLRNLWNALEDPRMEHRLCSTKVASNALDVFTQTIDWVMEVSGNPKGSEVSSDPIFGA